MKRVFLVCVLGLMVSASPVLADVIQLAWGDCLYDGGASHRASACTSNGGLAGRLVISYTPTESMPDFLAVDGVIDLSFDYGVIPPWWES